MERENAASAQEDGRDLGDEENEQDDRGHRRQPRVGLYSGTSPDAACGHANEATAGFPLRHRPRECTFRPAPLLQHYTARRFAQGETRPAW